MGDAMILLGVDPGLSGALAFMEAGHPAAVPHIHDMPTLSLSRGGKNKREIDVHLLARIIAEHMPIGHAFIELVGAMPGQGTSSMFAFGKAYGIVIGVLAASAVPMTFVSPVKWKKAFGVPAAKDGSRSRASQLLPGAAHQWRRIKDHGRAEAALICLWGERSLSSIAA